MAMAKDNTQEFILFRVRLLDRLSGLSRKLSGGQRRPRLEEEGNLFR